MSYRHLLRRPGAVGLLAAGLPARLPLAAYAIGLLALGHERYGTYGVGGALAATYTAASVVTGPLHGRWSRHPRYRWTLVGLTLVHALALVLLVVGAAARVPVLLLGLAAAVVGLALPPAGVIARARWSVLSGRYVERALFLESALDEAVFIVGPTLVTALGTVVGAGPALLLAGALSTVGCLGLAFLPPLPAPRRSTVERGPIPGLAGLGLAFLSVGVAFAGIQVAVLAFTGSVGRPGLGGPVLLVFSAVSLVAGVLLGARVHGRPVAVRHRAILVRLGLGLLPALLAPDPVLLAVLLLPAAVSAAPAVATGYARATELGGPDRSEAAVGWCAGALGAGLALGSVVAGALADAASWRAPLLLGTAALLVTAIARARRAAVPAGVAAALRPESVAEGHDGDHAGEASASVGASRAARSAG